MELKYSVFQLKVLLKTSTTNTATHPREWWQGDIKGMKVKLSTGEVKELDGSLYARTGIGSFISINAITPYTPPSAQDIIAKHNLSEEEIKIIKQS